MHLLEVYAARTAADRHERIRRLPVTVTTSEPRDGRKGVIRNYIVRGKVRVMRFVPDVVHTRTEAVTYGGPWAAQDEFCDDGEPAPCATEQDIDDADYVLAATDAEVEAQQEEYDAMNIWCQENPWNCYEQVDEITPKSGPNACMAGVNCVYQEFAAAVSLVMATAAGMNLRDKIVNARAATAVGATVAATGISTAIVATTGAVLAVGGSVYLLGVCRHWWSSVFQNPQPSYGIGWMPFFDEPLTVAR
jgi:hypothetical protein